MLRPFLAIGLLALALATGTVAAQDQSVRWEMSVDVTMTRPMQMTMPTYTATQCGPAEPLQQSPPMQDGDCKITDFQHTAQRASYKVTCDMDNAQMTGEGWAEKIDADHYRGHMTIAGSTSGMPMAMTMDYQGTRVGACKEG